MVKVGLDKGCLPGRGGVGGAEASSCGDAAMLVPLTGYFRGTILRTLYDGIYTKNEKTKNK